jgi:hypothetical protein
MRRIDSVGLSKSLGLGGLTAAITLALAALGAAPDASAQYRSTANTQVRSSTQQRYVSQTTRRVAVPVRNQRVYTAPRGATLLRSRYWDPRTRWNVDSRTHSTYSVLSNGEVWFLEPSSGWAYTVDRYGRVYGADPRRNSIYAFSSLHNWRGDLFYFFDFFSPYDGYYTVRDYDWFYSSYYGRRAPLYDYGYAYRTMWDDFDDYWFSNRFYRSVSFRYYEPAYIRYGSGWSSNYYYNSLPAVYIAPCYSYTVVNNTVVVNNNYYTNNNIVNNNGRGLPTAEQAAVQLAQQVAAPTVFAGNEISAQQIADAGISAPVEAVKEVSVEAAQPMIASEPVIEVPGLVVSEGNPTEIQSETQPVSAPVSAATENAGFGEIEKQPAYSEQPVDAQPVDVQPTEQPAFEAREEPVYSEQPREQAPSYSDEQQEPVYQEPAREEPAYQEPAYQEPAYESAREAPAQEEPVYQEPAYQEPAYESAREEPAYQEQDNAREEPAYEEPAYQEPVQEQPTYQEPNYQESAREEPSYQQQEQSYEQPSYQQQEQSYEQPSYQQQEQSYEQPSYQQQEQSYEQPSYQQQEQSYEQPEQSYEAPSRSDPEPSYDPPAQRQDPPQENSGTM